jgi:hypothetical protein
MIDLTSQDSALGNPTVKALATQDAQFNLGHV